MENSTLVSSVDKLAIAGERAGFTVEQLIRLLNAGLSVDSLLQVISRRLNEVDHSTPN